MKITEAKLVFTVDVSSYCMDDVIRKGKLLNYLTDALRQSADREYDFIWGNAQLEISGEVKV